MIYQQATHIKTALVVLALSSWMGLGCGGNSTPQADSSDRTRKVNEHSRDQIQATIKAKYLQAKVTCALWVQPKQTDTTQPPNSKREWDLLADFSIPKVLDLTTPRVAGSHFVDASVSVKGVKLLRLMTHKTEKGTLLRARNTPRIELEYRFTPERMASTGIASAVGTTKTLDTGVNENFGDAQADDTWSDGAELFAQHLECALKTIPRPEFQEELPVEWEPERR